jgi:predicted ArsR family transcriptional regulator
MLRRLLELVARTGTARSAELAGALGVSTAMIEPMLQELAQRGYLRPVAPGCTACASCPVRAACLFGSGARVWVLSAKGQELVWRDIELQPEQRVRLKRPRST